jgi:hypothetical protein
VPHARPGAIKSSAAASERPESVLECSEQSSWRNETPRRRDENGVKRDEKSVRRDEDDGGRDEDGVGRDERACGTTFRGRFRHA